MDTFPASFAGIAYSALFEFAHITAAEVMIAQEMHQQWPSSHLHIPNIIVLLQGAASEVFQQDGLSLPTKIIK
eukprot:10779202-Ditylum_brightwellii.AAC.2